MPVSVPIAAQIYSSSGRLLNLLDFLSVKYNRITQSNITPTTGNKFR